jgi:hypothetical protein
MDMLLNNQTTNYNDDPNRLWVEIDRGLLESITYEYLIWLTIFPHSGIRSKEPQRQFEAILKMPGLFKKETTSTTLLSAALIKLATLFQEGYKQQFLLVDFSNTEYF